MIFTLKCTRNNFTIKIDWKMIFFIKMCEELFFL